MSRLLKIAGLSALLLASSASAQVPGQHLVYSKTGYAPQMAMNPQQAVAYSVNGNTHYMPTMEATGGAPALYNKAARIPIYAPGPVTYHQQVIPGQVQYRTQMPVRSAGPVSAADHSDGKACGLRSGRSACCQRRRWRGSAAAVRNRPCPVRLPRTAANRSGSAILPDPVRSVRAVSATCDLL